MVINWLRASVTINCQAKLTINWRAENVNQTAGRVLQSNG